MRAKLENLVAGQVNRSFICYELNVPFFEFNWHFHPEYELTYIISGSGKRMVGDNVENFTDGDLVLVGPMLPHTWASDKSGRQPSAAIVMQFSAAFIQPFLAMPEFALVKAIFEKAGTGLVFKTSANSSVVGVIEGLKNKTGVAAISAFIDVMGGVCTLPARSLASNAYKPTKTNIDARRVNRVLEYIQKNFTQKITVSRAAAIIHVTESAFCKYFKRVMGKTFSDYLNDIRIAHACSLLIETDKPISLVATECGFENLSYFNRVFLRKKQIRPMRYREIKVS